MSLTRSKQRYLSGGHSNPDLLEVRHPRKRRFSTEAWGATLESSPNEILHLVPEWDDSVKYTANQLLLQAERFLCSDPKPLQEYPAVLRWDRLKERKRREIYNINGVPDPNICQGMYWRAHPQGRTIVKDHTAKGSSFYR